MRAVIPPPTGLEPRKEAETTITGGSLPPPSGVERVDNAGEARIEAGQSPLVVGLPASQAQLPLSRAAESVDHEWALTDDTLPSGDWAFAALKDAATYPWREEGWAVLIPGVVMAVVLTIGSLAPLIGVVAAVFFIGYLGKLYLEIISSTINGSNSLPAWPEVTSWSDDISSTARQIVGAALISYAPSLLYQLMTGPETRNETIVFLLNGLAQFYYPMACVSLVMDSGFLAAMPHKVLPAIFRSMPGYFLCVAVHIALTNLGPTAKPTAFVISYLAQQFIVAFLSLYFALIQARTIGLVARKYREQIGWGQTLTSPSPQPPSALSSATGN